MCKKKFLKNIFKTFYSSFLKKFACAQKVGFPRSGHNCNDITTSDLQGLDISVHKLI